MDGEGEVDICLPYAYFVIVVTDTTGLATFCYLMTYLMIELPTYLTYPATWLTHTTYITTQKCLPQSCSTMRIHAYPYVSMRIHAYPCVSIYTYLI